MKNSMNITSNQVHHQTPCASSVLAHFGVSGVTWNERTGRNVWDATLRRAGFTVASRKSKLGAKALLVALTYPCFVFRMRAGFWMGLFVNTSGL